VFPESALAHNPQVLVVGAGPTGLLLASELARRAVGCLLVEALDAPRDWDRATVVHPRSMEIFEALGLADAFLERGVKTRKARFHSDGAVLGELDLGLTDSRYRFDVGVSEEVTEAVLTAHLEALGGSVIRSTRLVDLRQADGEVACTLEGGGERREVAASWVVGCDGLHSAVRDLAGIDFPGADLKTAWAVFDATLDGWGDEFDVAAAYLDVPPVILTPLPGRRWRVYLRPTSESSDLVADAAQVVRAYQPQIAFTDVDNPVRFHCHSRVASRFRAGRLLLAGDAAHACTPAEGHGMNTGLQDAFNLGWKLALVCRGVSGPELLDSYETERRPVAMRVVASGDAAEAGQSLTRAADRVARDTHIRAAYADPASAHHEAVAAAELDRCYVDSDAVTGDTNGRLGPGDRLPDALPVDDSAGPRALHELTHRPGHTLLVVGGYQTAPAEVLSLVATLEAAHHGSPVFDAVVGVSPRAVGNALWRIDPAAADRLGIDGLTILAIRPDRYVGFRHDGEKVEAVGRYLEALGARRPPAP
jgi:2-polyprenyl-6-methoxyphenol hydroxylase-like FAD-dependent oxidoreductase